jgi:hypothetical protein
MEYGWISGSNKDCSPSLPSTLITLLRITYSGQIGSTKLVLPKWHKYGILNRVIRVGTIVSYYCITADAHPGVSKGQKFCERFKNTHCQVDHPAKIEYNQILNYQMDISQFFFEIPPCANRSCLEFVNFGKNLHSYEVKKNVLRMEWFKKNQCHFFWSFLSQKSKNLTHFEWVNECGFSHIVLLTY